LLIVAGKSPPLFRLFVNNTSGAATRSRIELSAPSPTESWAGARECSSEASPAVAGRTVTGQCTAPPDMASGTPTSRSRATREGIASVVVSEIETDERRLFFATATICCQLPVVT